VRRDRSRLAGVFRVSLATVLVLAALIVLSSASTAFADEPYTLVLRPDLSLKDQFGYDPQYPLNIPAFDWANRPQIRERSTDQHATNGVYVGDAGGWTLHAIWDAVLLAVPSAQRTVNAGGWETDRVVVSDTGELYTALTVETVIGMRVHVLLVSADQGTTWTAWRLPFASLTAPRADLDYGDFTYECEVGPNRITGVPVMAFWQREAYVSRWADRCRLYISQPRYVNGTLVVDKTGLVSRRALPPCQGAGGGSAIVSVAGRSYLVYQECRWKGSARGSPVFVATYSQARRKVVARTRIGFAWPADDVHCAPAICLDSQGYLHVVIGSHNGAFRYVRSLEARSATGGWTKMTPVTTVAGDDSGRARARQTYVSLVCDRNDVLHLVSRQWRNDFEHVAGLTYGALVHQTRRRGSGWSEPRILVVPPANGYVNYYQKLAVDRNGRLFLSLSCWTGSETAEEARASSTDRYRRRMVLICEDGLLWRLATNEDMFQAPAAP